MATFIRGLFVRQKVENHRTENSEDAQLQDRRSPARTRGSPTRVDRSEEKTRAGADPEKPQSLARTFWKQSCDESGGSRMEKAAAETGNHHASDGLRVRLCPGETEKSERIDPEPERQEL